jgi:hypothetical protein
MFVKIITSRIKFYRNFSLLYNYYDEDWLQKLQRG